jgi:hypothetical protein
MISAMLAAAAINSISAPYGVWARATWGATRPNVDLRIQNRSEVTASLVDVACRAYDAAGVLVATPTANVARLEPGETTHVWATADRPAKAVRFACQISVDAWYKPAAKAPRLTGSPPHAKAAPHEHPPGG